MRCERIKALQATVAKVEVLRCIPDAMLTEPIRTGKWSIREIIGHMYYWDKYNVEKMIPEMRNHAILPAFPDHDSHNAEAIRYIDTFDSLERIIDVFIHTRKALVQALSYVDSDITFYIADESGEYTVERFISIFTEHDLHHIRQIENHLAKNAVETQPDSSSAPLEQLDRLIGQHPRLHGALAGVSICDAITGRTIYEHMAATRLHPASNMKLLTAAAALETLGENYVWKTEIWIDGEIVGDELCGSLYIKGKGDPTLQPSDLEQFTADLYHRFGIRKITGDIVADDTWYDNVRLSPDMMWLDEHCYYGAQVSALTLSPDNDYDAGTVKINVRPGLGDGSPVEVSLYPDTNYIHIENNAITVAEQTNDVGIEFLRKHGENTVIMNGAIPLTAEKESEWIAVWEPTAYVLSVWVDKLRQKGIHISGNAKVDAVPETGKLLMQHESIPLCELLIPFMKLSNNGHGEILVKEMGKVVRGEGSWDIGMEVVLENAASFGIDTDNILLRDGSGISHVNLIAPQQLTNLLFFIQKKPWFDTYYRSLPIAGKKERMAGGTLRERLTGRNVAAKTGTIFGVSTLSGYMRPKSGERLIFSIMLNNLLDEEDGPDIEDKMIDILDYM